MTSRRAERRDQDQLSIKGTLAMLKELAASADATSWPAKTLEALKTQGALAKHEDVERGIRSMSLNHFKHVAADAADDTVAFDVLDALRRKALKQLDAAQAQPSEDTNRGTKEWYRSKVAELERLITQMREDTFVLQRAFDTRCVQARNYALVAGQATLDLCTREQRELEATFSICHRALDTTNVTSLAEARRAAASR